MVQKKKKDRAPAIEKHSGERRNSRTPVVEKRVCESIQVNAETVAHLS